MGPWIAVGAVVLVLVVVGVLIVRARSLSIPLGPSGFGAAALDPAAALALLEPTELLGCGTGHRAGVPLRGAVSGVDAVLFDVSYESQGESRTHGVVVLQRDDEGLRLPVFSLRPRELVGRQPELDAGDEASLAEPLADRYRLSGPAQGDVQLFFGKAVREALSSSPEDLWLEAAPGRLAVLSTGPLEEEQRQRLIDLAQAALTVVQAY